MTDVDAERGTTAISVMLIVPDATQAISWYGRALDAEVRWDLGGVAALEIGGAPFLIREDNPANPMERTPRRAGATSVGDGAHHRRGACGGRASQERLAAALEGLRVVWIGVRCDAAVAEARKGARPDRVAGMARRPAEAVHAGVVYDLVIDTTSTGIDEWAQRVAMWLRPGPQSPVS